jgi:hypothetical protein
MKRLIAHGLMFGNLVPVESPALVDRYNRALRHLGKPPTTLTDFHIDISGFSPEIADERDDPLYLNPDGANRQFILLTTAQKAAPLLNARFSTSRGILKQFIEGNEAQLFALTARDAVVGELDGSVFDLSTPDRLLDLRRITVRADTTEGHVAHAGRLATLIERFRSEPDAWWDDVLIADMIGLARTTGDVTRTPLHLPETAFRTDDFWTAHFGGLYLFRSPEKPAVIATGAADLGRLPLDVIRTTDRNAVARFLEQNELVEPIVKARGVDAAAILRQKIDFMVLDIAPRLGLDLATADRRVLRQAIGRAGADLPPAVHGLGALLRWVEGGGPWPRITSADPAYFYSLRARRGPLRDLVNMLLAELAPMDVRQLFICHKTAFYAAYATWPEDKRAWVADFLAREYAVDKAGARTALFGPEPGMDDDPPGDEPEPQAKPRPPIPDIAAVGPWGAVTRERR